jgi:hypothetical protein
MTLAIVTVLACVTGWTLGTCLASAGVWCVRHCHATLTGPGPEAYLD